MGPEMGGSRGLRSYPSPHVGGILGHNTDRSELKVARTRNPVTDRRFRIIEFHAGLPRLHRVRYPETCFRKPAKCGLAHVGAESGGAYTKRVPRAASPDCARRARDYRGTEE